MVIPIHLWLILFNSNGGEASETDYNAVPKNIFTSSCMETV